ncbi:unnamed protein product [Candidula unifasciata]|uniref:G-protein coupled receptors family 2 profile 2 domain-containing protein n=1 Tax=Candidula unifasciata TaxID=100452 RepID=A0A8S3ZVK2_9EUPU|nr:unnamed protein product [Candidula unifasciata]
MVLCTLFMSLVLIKIVETRLAFFSSETTDRSEAWEMSTIDQGNEDVSVRTESMTFEQQLITKAVEKIPDRDSLSASTPFSTSPVELKTFIWNRTTSPASFHHGYCKHTCLDSHSSGGNNMKTDCQDLSCFQCDCIRPRCEIYHTCCPDVSKFSPQNIPSVVDRSMKEDVSKLNTTGPWLQKYSQDSTGENLTETLKYYDTDIQSAHNYGYTKRTKSKLESNIRCDHNSFVIPFLFVRSCSSNVQVSDEVRSLCEIDTINDDVSMKSVARVTDVHTSVVYYNQYCALCNGINEWLLWSVTVECVHFLHVYTATTEEELLRQANRDDSSCSVAQSPRLGLEVVPCDRLMFRGEPVGACNVTGLWPEYDRGVEEGCNSLTGLVYRVYDGSASSISGQPIRLYRNIFCAICNREHNPRYLACTPDGAGGGFAPSPPLSILLGIHDEPPRLENNMHSNTCSNTEWLSPSGQCFPLYCSPGKILVNRTCETGLKQITGLRYHLRLWFLHQTDDVTETRDRITTSSVDVIGDIFYNKRKKQFDFQVPFGYYVTGDVVASAKITRDEFEQRLMRTLLRDTLEVEFNDGVKGRYQPIIMWGDDSLNVYCEHARKMSHDCLRANPKRNTDALFLVDTYEDVLEGSDKFLNVSELLTCSYIILQHSMFIVDKLEEGVLPSVFVKVNFSGVNVTFSSAAALNKMSLGTNGTLRVCLELFDGYKHKPQLVSGSTSERFLVQYILSVVCLALSMVCLLLALVTYAMFPALRSVAGRNNVCLCTTLMLAQAMILASSHMSPDLGVVCVAVGVATHFLWLSVMCWSFLCCFHMFRVFTSKTRSSYSTTSSRNILLGKNLACSLLLPAVVVVVVVVTMHTTSGGQSLGYGGSVCYLNSNILVGTVTVLPILSVSLINIAFFLITVVHIHRVRKLQKHESFKKMDLQHLYVYIKLSTMTGAFWVLSVTGEVLLLFLDALIQVRVFTQHNSLLIAGILLNGLQGLYIFISYTCNKRVLSLYLRRLGINSTTHTTMTAPSTDGSTVMRLTKRINSETHSHTSHALE